MQELLTGWDGPLGLALLALVAFGDTLIGIGFFVFGEVAFLSAGALFAAGGSSGPRSWCSPLPGRGTSPATPSVRATVRA